MLKKIVKAHQDPDLQKKCDIMASIMLRLKRH